MCLLLFGFGELESKSLISLPVRKPNIMTQMSGVLASIANNKKYHFVIFLGLLLILSVLLVLCYIPENKIYLGHDIHFQLRRLSSLMEALKHSSYPVYLDFDGALEFGHATKWFYPDFMLIPFAWLGNHTNIEFAYRCMILFYTFLCGIITYKSTEKLFKNTFTTTCASLLYTFALYRLFNLFQRAALAEAIAMTFIPLALLGSYHIIKGDYKKWYILTIGFSLIVMSHLLSAMMMLITITLFIFIFYKNILAEPKRLLYFALAGGVSIMLTASYLFPMVEQMLSNTFSYTYQTPSLWPQNKTLSIIQIIWGLFNGLNMGDANLFASIGILLTGLIALRIFIYKKNKELKFVDILVVIGLFYVFMASNLFPWQFYPFSEMKLIQFPFRFFVFSSLFFAIGGAYYYSELLKGYKRRYLGLCVIFTLTSFVIIMNGRTFRESTYLLSTGKYEDVPSETNNYHLANFDYAPIKFPSLKFIKERTNIVTTIYPDTEIKNLKRNFNTTTFNITLNKQEDIVEVPRCYYKGYSVFLNGRGIPFRQSETGLIEFSANESGKADVIFTGTFLQKYSHYISLFTLLCLIFFIYTRQLRKRLNLKRVVE